jgi:hypothetical protein
MILRKTSLSVDEKLALDTVLVLIAASRIVGQCQSATAEALEIFGRIDVLLICKSEGRISYDYFFHAMVLNYV